MFGSPIGPAVVGVGRISTDTAASTPLWSLVAVSGAVAGSVPYPMTDSAASLQVSASREPGTGGDSV